MKKVFVSPECEIVEIEALDIVTASCSSNTCSNDAYYGGNCGADCGNDWGD